MAGDFSRNSVNRAAGYTGVLMQQGRVQLDADWNEQLGIAQHRTQTETRDVIGCCGTPKGEDGFKVELTPDGSDLFIHLGRFYAGGLLCESASEWVRLTFQSFIVHQPGLQKILHKSLPTPFLPSSWLDGRQLQGGDWVEIRASGLATIRTRIVSVAENLSVVFSDSVSAYENVANVFLRRALTYLTQPFYPAASDSGAGSPLSGPAGGILEHPDGEYLVYLEAWQREVDALEDPHLREVALGGPDTATRLKTVWQVKLLPIAEHVDFPHDGHRPCQEKLPEWTQLVTDARTTGQLSAHSTPPKPDANPCLLPPSAGYQGLGNQLYRVEIFRSGDALADATYVWSRDNAMVEMAILSVDPVNTNVITVNDLGKDDLHTFSVGDWVEVVDRDGELGGAMRFLAQIVAPAPDPSTKEITLSASVPSPGAINAPGSNVFRLRRWDMSGSSVTPDGIAITSGWLALEAGIEVSFSDGRYVSGSHWLVPARTATADVEWPPFQVPNTEPVPQPALGDVHHFCRLALIEIVYAKLAVRRDCRLQFPSLTDICADDICYESNCDCLKDAKTVKAALDKLCELVKLRFHKKYLHGWGIVCDLQVSCAGDEAGAGVIVNKGYAIDCEGNDILLLKPVTVDVLSQIRTPSGIDDGAYSLFFDTRHDNQLTVLPYTPPASPLASALAGTFWADYYEQYLKPLIEVWKELQQDSQPIISSLTNLLVQFMNPQTGSHVYISKSEHEVLTDLYRRLKERLRDNTFCAIFEDAKPPASYSATIAGIESSFVNGFKTRLRLNETGELAAAVGNDNTIHIYEIHGERVALTRELTFPGDSALVVQDVAFAGETLYAIATSAGSSSFAQTPLGSVAWTTVALPGVTLSTLVVQANIPYATAVGKGLYACQTGKLELSFNAIGQILAPNSDTERLFATSSSTTGVITQFNEVISITHTPSGFVQSGAWPLQNALGTQDDDLDVVVDAQGQRIFVTASPTGSANKALLVNYSSVPGTNAASWAQVDLAANSGRVRLAYQSVAGQMLLSLGGSNRIVALTESATTNPQLPHSLSLSDAYPAEVTPASFVFSARAQASFVLNAISNTISVIPVETKHWSSARFAALAAYRTTMLEAYVNLLGIAVQYLKDGFCDLLLLKCQVCERERDQPVYLAGLTVKDGRVYKICNLSQRRYVKTFPGVSYWLSIVPILPLAELAIRELCCLILSDLFAKIKIPQQSKDASSNFVEIPSASAAYSAANSAKALNFASIVAAIQTRIAPASGITADYVRSLFKPSVAPPVAPSPPPVAAAAVSGQPVAQAQKALAAEGVMVNVASYDPSKLAANIYQAASAPAQIPAGSSATLFADQTGIVKYFTVAQAQPAVDQTELAAAQPAADLQNDIATLKAQLTSLQAAHTELQSSLSAMTNQIAKLAPAPPKV